MKLCKKIKKDPDDSHDLLIQTEPKTLTTKLHKIYKTVTESFAE
jgi:hypothetical protein